MDQLYLLLTNSWVLIPVLVWTLFWKACSLWIASQSGQKKWFVAILVLNTFGILEIVYIFFISKKNWSDIKGILNFSDSSKK